MSPKMFWISPYTPSQKVLDDSPREAAAPKEIRQRHILNNHDIYPKHILNTASISLGKNHNMVPNVSQNVMD